MQISDNELPGSVQKPDQDELDRLTRHFFEEIDRRFSGKYIIWSQWDHDSWDSDAVYLCRKLGYSSGADFLMAYGYSIETDSGVLRPWYSPAVSDASAAESSSAAGTAAEAEPHTGKIFSILPNNNSGFVRDDATGRDYYFNIRSFTRWIDKLEVGRPVRFRVEARMDHRRGRLRDTAVALEYTDVSPNSQKFNNS